MPTREIDIPPDDVFRNDLLGREPGIVERTGLLEKSALRVIAIDSGWGSGKTTFMKLWAAYLRLENWEVVEFNAWKGSLSGPMDSLTKGILGHFDKIEESSVP